MTIPIPFTFSQSSLQDYSDCPRRFQLRYIEDVQWPAVEMEPVLENERRQQEGQLFHRMVQQQLVGLPVENISRLANTPDLARWWENYRQAKDLQGFKESFELHPELTLSSAVGKHWLVAKYDLVAVNPGDRVLIYDWKTYRKRPRDEWMAARMQTRVYRSLLVQAGAYLNGGTPVLPEKVEMIYWFADFPSEPARFPYNSALHERDWNALVGLINEISNHQHFPLTGDEKKCAYCPYRSYCNRGGKAGTLDELTETELSLTEINYEQIAEIEF
jgi:CRISPR/Cas system-associated exonuclease Cas4 (RecB family)